MGNRTMRLPATLSMNWPLVSSLQASAPIPTFLAKNRFTPAPAPSRPLWRILAALILSMDCSPRERVPKASIDNSWSRYIGSVSLVTTTVDGSVVVWTRVVWSGGAGGGGGGVGSTTVVVV